MLAFRPTPWSWRDVGLVLFIRSTNWVKYEIVVSFTSNKHRLQLDNETVGFYCEQDPRTSAVHELARGRTHESRRTLNWND
jgi:hypothetical protein